MSLATRETLLAKNKRRYKTIEFEGDQYRLQSLFEGERQSLEQYMRTDEPEEQKYLKPKAIQLCMVDEAGHRVFTDEDLDGLLQVDARYTAALWSTVAEMCGFSKDEIEMVEEAEGN